MGMFDWVILPFKCPFCKFEQLKPNQYEEGVWQTKSTICSLNIYKRGNSLEFDEIIVKEGEIEIHNVCPNCDKYVSASVKVKNGKLTDEITYLRNVRG